MIILVAIGITVIFGIAFGGIFRPSSLYAVPHSDEEFIAKAKEQPEVQAFLTKYPNTTVSIERGSDVVVAHTVSKSVHEGKPIDPSNVTAARHDSYLLMEVFMGDKSLRVQQTMLVCYGGDVIYNANGTGWTRELFFYVNNSDIIPYLQQGKEEICFE